MITYVKGDATYPQGDGQKFIIHIVNDIGKWGAGFVLAISKRWTEPEIEYKKWYRQRNELELGKVQFVQVESGIIVANMVAQHGTGQQNGPPIRYGALETCLRTVAERARKEGASVHGPRFGAGLSGGDWATIEKLVQENLNDLNVIIYDFERF